MLSMIHNRQKIQVKTLQPMHTIRNGIVLKTIRWSAHLVVATVYGTLLQLPCASVHLYSFGYILLFNISGCYIIIISSIPTNVFKWCTNYDAESNKIHVAKLLILCQNRLIYLRRTPMRTLWLRDFLNPSLLFKLENALCEKFNWLVKTWWANKL